MLGLEDQLSIAPGKPANFNLYSADGTLRSTSSTDGGQLTPVPAPSIGIDFGTTNSSVAITSRRRSGGARLVFQAHRA